MLSQNAIPGTTASVSMQIQSPNLNDLEQNFGGGTQPSELLQALQVILVQAKFESFCVRVSEIILIQIDNNS